MSFHSLNHPLVFWLTVNNTPPTEPGEVSSHHTYFLFCFTCSLNPTNQSIFSSLSLKYSLIFHQFYCCTNLMLLSFFFLYTPPSVVYSKDARLIQYLKINHYNYHIKDQRRKIISSYQSLPRRYLTKSNTYLRHGSFWVYPVGDLVNALVLSGFIFLTMS